MGLNLEYFLYDAYSRYQAPDRLTLRRRLSRLLASPLLLILECLALNTFEYQVFWLIGLDQIDYSANIGMVQTREDSCLTR